MVASEEVRQGGIPIGKVVAVLLCLEAQEVVHQLGQAPEELEASFQKPYALEIFNSLQHLHGKEERHLQEHPHGVKTPCLGLVHPPTALQAARLSTLTTAQEQPTVVPWPEE